MNDEVELRVAWKSSIGATPDAMMAFDDVVGRHREAHRRYHDVRHVTWVIRHVRWLAATEPADDVDAVVAAAFFHDAIYEPIANDNEARSAALAGRVLGQLGWRPDRCRTVAALVRATEHHLASADPGVGVLNDADLAVLGSEPAAYQAYVTGVRAEYAHVDDDGWRRGRAAVLRRLLERQALYATSTARRRWESPARANMTAELAALE
ncbi:MAG: HD domain-containing protein [Ilumatobacteraceae bacterium]